MASLGCKLLVHVEPPTAFFRIVGRAAVENAADFKRAVIRFDAEGMTRFCLDFSQCVLIDSTFAGVLGSLADRLKAEDDHTSRLAIWRPNPRVADLLDNLDVLRKVKLLPNDDQACGSKEGSTLSPAADKAETAACCLEAHRYLMTLSPANQSKFRELTRMLEVSAPAAG